jgi:hypothetical protein
VGKKYKMVMKKLPTGKYLHGKSNFMALLPDKKGAYFAG